MLKIIFTLAYPFACVCFLVWFFLLQWSSIYWCEQMWKPLVVIKMMETLQF